MTTRAYLDRPTISVAYLELLVELLEERGIGADRLLSGIPIERELLARPDARMSATQWTRLVLRALELTGEPGLGYAYGLRMRPTLHGILGYAAMSSASLRDALEVSIRYTSVRQAHFRMELEEDGGRAIVVLRERFPIPVVRSFFHENVLLGLVTATRTVLGRPSDELADVELWFDRPEPPYYPAYQERLPKVRFSARVSALSFPASYLELRPVLADPHASKAAIAHCERELALAPDFERDVVMRVRAELERSGGADLPQIDDVAARLRTSTRTLKRHLARSGTSFLAIRKDVQRRTAQDLLAHSGLSIQAIAGRVGFENPANFSRAFVAWTGEAPTRYRERIRERASRT